MAGRPRSTRADDALREAVLTSVTEHGYGATSIESVARAAGVPRSTLYRRWGSKAEMVFQTVVHDRTLAPPPDTGSLLGDLTAVSRAIVAALATPAARRAVPGLLDDIAGDATSAFRTRVVDTERRFVATALTRAVDRGELDGRTDVVELTVVLHAQLLGTTLAWTTVLTEPVPADLADRLARATVATIPTQESVPCSTT